MADDIVKFERAEWMYLDGRDDPKNDALGFLFFGASWPKMKARLKRSAERPHSGGTMTVTRVDRDAGTITVGKK
jgi:hypothetical protein